MNSLNLVPKNVKNKKIKYNETKKNAVLLLVLVSLLFIFLSIPYFKLKFLSITEKELKSTVEKANSNNKAILREKKNADMYITCLNMLKKDRMTISDKIRLINKCIPQDTQINNLSFYKTKLTISAETKNFYTMEEFEKKINTTGESINARVEYIKYDSENNAYIFTINIYF